MADNLYEVLTEATKGMFFRYTELPIIPVISECFYRITAFGSLYCDVEVYDKNGKFIKQTKYPTDTLHHYKLIPKNQLPKALRLKESQLAEKTQSLSVLDLDLFELRDDMFIPGDDLKDSCS